MKRTIPILAFFLSLIPLPAPAQEKPAQIPLEELKKQLVASVDEELANNKELEERYTERLKMTNQLIRDTLIGGAIERNTQLLQVILNHDKISQKSKNLAQACLDRMTAEVKDRQEQYVKEVTEKTGAFIRNIMKSEDPELIRKVSTEFNAFRNKLSSESVRDERVYSSKLSAAGQFMDYAVKLQEARADENWSNAASHLRYIEQSIASMGAFVAVDETKAYTEKLRLSIGLLSQKDFEALLIKTIDEILNDSNQDRLDEIMSSVRRYSQICSSMSSSGYSSISSRWQRVDSFGKALQQSIESAKSGEIPQIRPEPWTRSDSGYASIMKDEEMVSRLKKYRIRTKDKSGKVTESRVYYDMDELLVMIDEIVAELLDDANQDRLEEIQEKAMILRRYCSNSSYSSSPAYSRLQQFDYFARPFIQSVRRAQNGGSPQISIEQWLNQQNEFKPLMSKKVLLEKIKKYHVKVTGENEAAAKQPLYLDLVDVMARIATVADLRKELPALTKTIQGSMNESGANEYSRLLPSITRSAEISEKLEAGNAFVLASAQSPYIDSYSRSYPTPQTEHPMFKKIVQFDAELEHAILKRLFPKQEFGNVGDHESFLRSLMKRFIEAKNYDGIDKLHRVSIYFKPSRMLLSQTQAQVVRDYLDGIRQEEVLEQPRLAVFHYQKAASANSSIVDAESLKARLQKMRLNHPEDYEKGIEDSLKLPSAALSSRELEVPAAP